jgi:hypothetical protein
MCASLSVAKTKGDNLLLRRREGEQLAYAPTSLTLGFVNNQIFALIVSIMSLHTTCAAEIKSIIKTKYCSDTVHTIIVTS